MRIFAPGVAPLIGAPRSFHRRRRDIDQTTDRRPLDAGNWNPTVLIIAAYSFLALAANWGVTIWLPSAEAVRPFHHERRLPQCDPLCRRRRRDADRRVQLRQAHGAQVAYGADDRHVRRLFAPDAAFRRAIRITLLWLTQPRAAGGAGRGVAARSRHHRAGGMESNLAAVLIAMITAVGQTVGPDTVGSGLSRRPPLYPPPSRGRSGSAAPDEGPPP